MQISEAVYRALMGSRGDLCIVADWIEDSAPGHPEAGTYCRRLRDPESLRVQTLFDVIAKFGTRGERKEICRIQRIVLRCRKNTIPVPLRLRLTELKSLAARRQINHRLGNIIPEINRFGGDGFTYFCHHKRVVLADFRRRRVYLHDPAVQNNWTFLQHFRELLKITRGE